ncbi:hypothetical protein DFH11DRAFT_1880056 [Phellopilus nigrolimitatus]|nr:hypothetical protein DFH11DRAFT_1880056 [Phellopilus nigrolimitatus]
MTYKKSKPIFSFEVSHDWVCVWAKACELPSGDDGSTDEDFAPSTGGRNAAESTSTRPEDKVAKTTTYYAGSWDRFGLGRRVSHTRQHDPHALPAALAGDAHQLNRGRAQGAAGGLRVAAQTRLGEAAKQAFKTAGPARQEQSRLEVENAEDDLVQKTEVAITLMKTVLENVRTSSVQS